MAIAYARAQQMSRGKAHCAIERLAYISRCDFTDRRTGRVHDFRTFGPVAATGTVVPADAGWVDESGEMLWHAVENASRRADAVLGVELLLALPKPGELSRQRSLSLVQDFINDVVVRPHGLGVSYAIHEPQAGENENGPPQLEMPEGDQLPDLDVLGELLASNRHVHLLITPRQVLASGLARHRYTALDPAQRNGKTVAARRWGEFWGHYQNRFFAREGLKLRVVPNPPVALDPAPLKAVRRWRKRTIRKSSSTPTGRELMVNAAREDANRALVGALEDSLSSLRQPVTRLELLRYYRRYLSHAHAEQLVSAAIGLGAVHELGQGGANPWLVPTHVPVSEVTSFAHSLMLANRKSHATDVSDRVAGGFPRPTRETLSAIFNAPDLVVVHASADPLTLKTDIEAIGDTIPHDTIVEISTSAGHAPGARIVVPAADLTERMVSGATIIVDDVDALDVQDLELVTSAALAGVNRLALIRRFPSDWPRLELVDLLAHHACIIDWPKTEPWTAVQLLEAGKISDALEALQRLGRLYFSTGSLTIPGKPVRPEAVPQPDVRATLARRFGIAANGNPGNNRDRTELIYPLTRHSIRYRPMLAAMLTRTDAITLVIDSTDFPTRDALANRLGLARPIRGATSYPVNPMPGQNEQPEAGWPRWALGPDLTPTTAPADIVRAIGFFARAPLPLEWECPQWDRALDLERLDRVLELQFPSRSADKAAVTTSDPENVPPPHEDSPTDAGDDFTPDASDEPSGFGL
jgi:hypothetical protein